MNKRRTALATFGIAAGGVALIAVGLARFDFPGRDVVADALGPIAALLESNSNDSAGDRLVPGDDDDRFPRVPAPFDDERVVEAIAPLAPLAEGLEALYRRYKGRGLVVDRNGRAVAGFGSRPTIASS